MTKVNAFLAGRIYQYAQTHTTAQTARKFPTLSYPTIRSTLIYGPPKGVYKERKVTEHIKKRRQLVKKLALSIGVKNNVTFPRFPSAPSIAAELNRQSIQALAKTVQRDLVHLGMKCLVRKKVPTRDPEVEKTRLTFSARQLKKGSAAMRKNCFSDEHTCSTNDHSDRLQWVFTNDQVIPREEKRKQNAYCLQVWAVIGVGYKSRLVLLKKPKKRRDMDDDDKKPFRQNARSYIDKCLSKVAADFSGNSQRIFQQDGATCHTANSVLAYMERKNIQLLLNWPPYSPDLNPIEQLWAELDRRISNMHPQNDEQLEAAALSAWASIPQDMIDNFVLSFETKCKNCVKNKGKCTGG